MAKEIYVSLLNERLICRQAIEQMYHLIYNGTGIFSKRATNLIEAYRARCNDLSIQIRKYNCQN